MLKSKDTSLQKNLNILVLISPLGGQSLIDITEHGGDGREGEMVNSNIPRRIKNLLFGGQSQKKNPVSMRLCLLLICFFICSFILSMPPCFVCFTDITLFFHPPHLPLSFPPLLSLFLTLHSPHPSFRSLPLCHPGLFVPIFSPSP